MGQKRKAILDLSSLQLVDRPRPNPLHSCTRSRRKKVQIRLLNKVSFNVSKLKYEDRIAEAHQGDDRRARSRGGKHAGSLDVIEEVEDIAQRLKETPRYKMVGLDVLRKTAKEVASKNLLNVAPQKEPLPDNSGLGKREPEKDKSLPEGEPGFIRNCRLSSNQGE